MWPTISAHSVFFDSDESNVFCRTDPITTIATIIIPKVTPNLNISFIFTTIRLHRYFLNKRYNILHLWPCPCFTRYITSVLSSSKCSLICLLTRLVDKVQVTAYTPMALSNTLTLPKDRRPCATSKSCIAVSYIFKDKVVIWFFIFSLTHSASGIADHYTRCYMEWVRCCQAPWTTYPWLDVATVCFFFNWSLEISCCLVRRSSVTQSITYSIALLESLSLSWWYICYCNLADISLSSCVYRNGPPALT